MNPDWAFLYDSEAKTAPFNREDGRRVYEQLAKSYVGLHGDDSKGCELPNLRDGDIVHLRATFRRPASWSPTTHGVFRFGGIGGLEVFAPFAEIVDVELPPFAVGDHVVTPNGRRGTVVGLRRDEAHISLGTDGWGERIMVFHNVDTLTRRD